MIERTVPVSSWVERERNCCGAQRRKLLVSIQQDIHLNFQLFNFSHFHPVCFLKLFFGVRNTGVSAAYFLADERILTHKFQALKKKKWITDSIFEIPSNPGILWEGSIVIRVQIQGARWNFFLWGVSDRSKGMPHTTLHIHSETWRLQFCCFKINVMTVNVRFSSLHAWLTFAASL